MVADHRFGSGQSRSLIVAVGLTAAVADRGYRPNSRGRGLRLQAWQPRSETVTIGLTAAVGGWAVLVFVWMGGKVHYFDVSLMRLRCVIDRMPPVPWREREVPEEIVTVVREDRWVQSLLGLFGLLKFAEVPIMRSAGLLLTRLVGFWEPDTLAFRVQGERVDLTLTDVYFLTGFPYLGRVADTQPRVFADLDLDDVVERLCRPGARVHRNALLVRDLREPAVQVMTGCVVCILGSQSPEKVSGGQMQLVERVLAGTYFAWGQMFLTCVQR